MLQKIKIRAARIIERDNLTVNDSVLRQVAESIEHVLILSGERLPPSGVEAQLAMSIDRERSVPIQLNLVHSVRSVRRFRDRETFHRFHEASFSAG